MILVIDTETTGLSPETDNVVELAVVQVDLKAKIIARYGQTLVNPGREIPHVASAIHHIVGRDVLEAPVLGEAAKLLVPDDADAYCAHNATFDRGFLKELPERPWVCTWKCANAVWSDAPSYGNQVLRYWLGIDVPVLQGRGAFPHSALYDALTTAQILIKLLEERTLEELVSISERPMLMRKMTFGKHAGLPFAEVPKDYRAWLRRQPNLDEDLKHTLDHYAGS